ncbi:hypothetical protein [Staphylococcus xylosus]|uniref:hypothetical protein n=1 Tax=Staphylococcus xylosus TaxID=1288 RepID=UPI003F5625A5
MSIIITMSITGSFISGIVVALINQWGMFRKMRQEFKENQKNLNDEFKRRVKLETSNHLITNRLDRIEKLQDLLISQYRLSKKSYDIYLKFYYNSMDDNEVNLERYWSMRERLESLDGGDELSEKEINKNLNYFPEIKRQYKTYQLTENSFYITSIESEKIITDYLGTEKFKNVVEDYKCFFGKYEEKILLIMDEVNNEHQRIINSLEITSS